MPNLQKNLNALLQINPAMVETLEPVSAGTISIRAEFSPNQFQAQLIQLSQQQIKQIVLIGTGSGRVIQRILDVLNPLRLVVIEPNSESLLALFNQQDFSQPIQQKQLYFGVGNTIQSLGMGLKNVKTSLAAHGYQILINPEVYIESSPDIQPIVQTIQLIIEQESLFLRMRLARADLCQLNLIQNLPAMLESISIDSLTNICVGKSALIIAAGPSLDESLEEIKQVKDRFIIFAVDTAVRTLLKKSIHPHIVVTTDPTKDNAKHFDGVVLDQNTVTAFIPDCQTLNIQRYKSHPHKLCLFDDSTHLTYWMQKYLGFKTIVKRPLNVSEAAVRLAVHMGFETIVFSGLDLAIPAVGGNTHSCDAAHSFAIQEMDEGKIRIQKHDGSEDWLPVVEVDGWNEERVLTYPSFQMYLREMEIIIHEFKKNWVDCTKYGAKKKGCRRLQLSDASEHFGKPKDENEQILSQIHHAERFQSHACMKALKEGICLLESYQTRFQTMINDELNLQEREDLWNDFLQDGTVKALLDHVVFRFQFAEPINRIEPAKRMEVLKQYAGDAHHVLTAYIPFLTQHV